MFKNTFQSGFLSILYSIGSKPLQIWDKKVGLGAAAVRGGGATPPPRLGTGDGEWLCRIGAWERRRGRCALSSAWRDWGARWGRRVSSGGGEVVHVGGRGWDLSVLQLWCG